MYAGKVLIWAVYVWILTKFILLKHIPSLHSLEMADGSGIARRWKEANVMPFHTIGLFLAPSNLPLSIRIQNLLGNVLLFVPFGFLLPGSFRRFQRIMLTIGAAAVLSLFYEVIQLLFDFGSFDVDDLLLNTLGGFIGYMLFAAFRKRTSRTA